MSYDAYVQGVKAVRKAGMPGFLEPRVRTVLGAGVSQSAGRLAVFTNTIQTRTRSVLDAVLLYIGSERMRDDLDVPVFKVLSETEYTAPASANEITSLQPDTDRMHTWTVAGTSHSDWASFAASRVAQGQSDERRRSGHYAAAVNLLDRYIDGMETLRGRGRATEEQAQLLSSYAGILIDELSS